MTALSYSASPGGHYAEVTVSPGAVDTFALYAGSYNGYDIFPAYFAVSNTNNALPVTVTFGDGSTAIVPPFTSSAIVCAGRRQARLTNNGGQAIIITVFDAGHAKLYLDQYNSQPWVVPGSDNILLLHFTGDDIVNYGNGVGLIASNGSNSELSASGKFANGGALDTIGAATTNTFLNLELEGGFDMNTTWTLDFWMKPNINADAAQEMLVTITDAGVETLRFSYRGTTNILFNGATIGTIPLNVGAWNHIALIKRATCDLYVNGVLDTSNFTAIATLTYAAIRLKSGVNPATTGADCSISEVRFRIGAQWITNFTPPAKPYT